METRTATHCHAQKAAASCGAVSATQRGKGTRADRPPGTLGELLYADHSQKRVSEVDWVYLVHAIDEGDQRALAALYERTHRLVFTFLVRLLKDRRSAEELTVDTFHAVWCRAAKYDPSGGPVLGWIMNQARSRAIDRLRYEQRKKRTVPPAGDDAFRTEGNDST